MKVSEEVFKFYGAAYTNSTAGTPKADKRFRSTFGTTPFICELVYEKIVDNIKAVHPSFGPYHLLWGLLFLKNYSNEAMLASKVGCSEKTFRKWYHIVVLNIALITANVVCYYSFYLIFYYCK